MDPTARIRVILVENSESDAAEVVRHLQGDGCEVEAVRAETAEQLRAALNDGPWSCVLAECQLPSLSGIAALRLAQEMDVDLPFIFVIGDFDEDRAAEMMRVGARDCVPKQAMARLGPVVQRELRDAAERRERRRAEGEQRIIAEAARPRRMARSRSELVDDVAASAIRRATLHEETELRSKRLHAQRSIDLAITLRRDLETVFDILLDQLASTLRADAVCILRLDLKRGVLRQAAARGFGDHSLAGIAVPLGEGQAGRMTADQRLAEVLDLSSNPDPCEREQALAAAGFVTYHALPLVARGKLRGGLEVLHRTRFEPGVEWTGSLQTVAWQAAIALDAAALFDDLGLLHAAVEALPIGLTLTDQTGVILYVNPAEASIHGTTVEELLGQSARTMAPKGTWRAMTPDELNRRAAWVRESENLHRDGTTFPVLLSSVAVRDDNGEVRAFATTCVDISEQRRAERLLRVSGEISGEFLTAPNPFVAVDRVVELVGQATEAQRCFWLEAGLAANGSVTASLRGEWCGDGVKPLRQDARTQQIRADRFAGWRERLEQGEVILTPEDEVPVSGQGLLEELEVGWLVLAPLIVNGRLVACLGLERSDPVEAWRRDEVSLLRMASQAFAMAWERHERRRRAAELAAVVEQSSEAVVMTSLEGRVTYANDAFSRLTGFAQRDIEGCSAAWFVVATDRAPTSLAAENGRNAWCRRQWIRREGQEPVEVRTTSFPLLDESDRVAAYAAIHSDLSTQRVLEKRLRFAARMEALGQFASSIAHDFNNLLSVYESTSWLLRKKLELAHADLELQILERATRQGTELARALLGFARQQVLEKRTLNLAELVEGVMPMLRRMMPENIILGFDPAPSPVRVRVDQAQIEQVILNLAANARDAMPEGGRMTLTVREAAVGPAFAAVGNGATVGSYGVLEVRDTGVGMDSATKERVFEPFFTTKPVGHGTGLGLASVFGIVEQHEGYVTVDSAPGMGSTFAIYLPLTAADMTEPGGRRHADGSARKPLRVLLVEDEPDLLLMMKGVLTELGHAVCTAASGEEGLGLLAVACPPFDVIVTDVLLPTLTGVEMYRQLAGTGCVPAVLFLSGYNREQAQQLPAGPGVGFMAKPFEIDALTTRLHELVAEARQRSLGSNGDE